MHIYIYFTFIFLNQTEIRIIFHQPDQPAESQDEQLFSAIGLLDRYAAASNTPVAAGPGAFALVLAVPWIPWASLEMLEIASGIQNHKKKKNMKNHHC